MWCRVGDRESGVTARKLAVVRRRLAVGVAVAVGVRGVFIRRIRHLLRAQDRGLDRKEDVIKKKVLLENNLKGFMEVLENLEVENHLPLLNPKKVQAS